MRTVEAISRCSYCSGPYSTVKAQKRTHNHQATRPMPELPELSVVQAVLNRPILGQTIVSAEAIPPGAAIVIRDLTGAGIVRP
jgi:hypothetical protein